ncbi:molybdopterin-dependent oxidoreductase [Nesterenkonia sp. NBAIMH1]|uniref:molybdopterin-dependent oxidoreductase n=1 Tax=Nesterenkonia sp. NBAIMH1 TaxID=2600320 RepID=UPI0011B5F3A9|nr:molybdopterin-dependent oxidoreductase [Nesterenkonia sp. NBAIMH1]
MTRTDPSPGASPSLLRCAAAGIAAAAVFLGIADVVARFFAPSSSPLVALGNTIIGASPPGLQEFAISVFGSSNKLVLFLSMGLGGAAAAALIGMLARRSLGLGAAAFAVVAASLAAVVLTRPDAGPADAVPTLTGAALGVSLLAALILTAWSAATRSQADAVAEAAASRRAFLGLAAAGTAAAGVSFALGRSVRTFGREAVGAVGRLVLPSPAVRAAIVPESASSGAAGAAPFITPNSDFYRIDTALAVPELHPDEWTLRIHGLVENEVMIDMHELLELPLEEHHITLTCVSNPVGGDLVGNASWLGYPVRQLLAEAGPLPEADMVLSQSIDGFTASTPLEALTDERSSLLAVGMNGEPLPAEHGYPARLVVPGLYGYVSATKWVVDLEVTRFDRETAYWTDRGWDERAPVLVASRIEVPSPLETLPAGDVVIAGSAWAQHVGIERVEVQIDGGEWEPAELSSEVSIDTWRQWRHMFSDAQPGRHWVSVRAISADGEVQTGDRRDPIPNAATGRHRIDFEVQ